MLVYDTHHPGGRVHGWTDMDVVAIIVVLMQNLDDLWAAFNDGTTDERARLLMQNLDHFDRGGSTTAMVDGSWARAAARDHLHLVHLWGGSIAIAASIATTAGDASLLVNDFNHLYGSMSVQATVSATVATAITATVTAATASQAEARLDAAAATTTAAAATSEQSQKAGVRHGKKRTQTHKDLNQIRMDTLGRAG